MYADGDERSYLLNEGSFTSYTNPGQDFRMSGIVHSRDEEYRGGESVSEMGDDQSEQSTYAQRHVLDPLGLSVPSLSDFHDAIIADNLSDDDTTRNSADPPGRNENGSNASQRNENYRRPQTNEQEIMRRVTCFFSILTCPIVPLTFCLVGLLTYMSIAAFVVDREKPCDQPLKSYAIGSVCISLYMPFHKMCKRIFFDYSRERDGPGPRPVRVRIYDEFFQGCLLTWLWLGVAFVTNCQTCQDTAPHLFYSSRDFVFCLVTCLVFLILPLAFLPCVYVYLVRAGASSFVNITTPPNVIENLEVLDYDPDIFNDSIYPKECCICMSEFRNYNVENDVEQNGGNCLEHIVKTDCGHVFHKSCLSGWLSGSSRHCPICRSNLVTLYEERQSQTNHEDRSPIVNVETSV